MSRLSGMASNIERDIGALLAQVADITEALKRQDESRSKLYTKVDTLSDELISVKSELNDIKNDLADAKKVSEEVKQ